MKVKVKLPNGKYIEESSSKTSVVLGRSNKADIVIPDESLSRSHCLLEYNHGDFFITDLGSSNGIFLDGKKLIPDTRTPFTTFQELIVGQLEVTVSDDDHGVVFKETPVVKNLKADESTKQVKSSASENPKKFQREKKKSSNATIVISFVAMAIITVAFIYHTKEREVAKNLPVGMEKNIPAELKVAPDENLSFETYKEKDALKSCDQEEAFCKELQISEENGEGIFADGAEYIVFMRASEDVFKGPFEILKEAEDGADVVSLYKLLKSGLFQKFINKETSQVQLVLKDADFKLFKVYRFHTKYFAKGGPEKSRLLTELEVSLSTGNAQGFWLEAQPLLQKKSL